MADFGELITQGALAAALMLLVQGAFLPIIVQRFRSVLERQLESLRQEFSLAHTTYERNLDLILEYYGLIYQHYRVCQEAASFDIMRNVDGSERYPKIEYLDKVEALRLAWNEDEGKVRLLLPERLLGLHERTLGAINGVTRAVKDYRDSEQDSDKEAIVRAFECLHEERRQLEEGLRDFLRSEKLLTAD